MRIECARFKKMGCKSIFYIVSHSWFHFVGIQESMQMFWVLLVWKEAPQASGRMSVFSMFADFSLISNLCSHVCLFSLIVWTIRASAPLQGLPYAVSTPCAPKGAHRPAILMLRHRLKNPDRILADLQVVDLHRPCASHVLIIRYSYNCCTTQPYVLLSYSPLMRRPLPESGSTVFRKTSQKKHLTL